MSTISTTGPRTPGRRAAALAALAAAGLILAAAALSACGTDTSQTSDQASDASSCTDLAGTSIPASAIGLPTSGGYVARAQLVSAEGTGETATAEYCEVQAALKPVDPNAQNITMTIGLPTNWNNKAWMLGGGGYNGTERVVGGSWWDGGTPLITRGYVTFGSDSGHVGRSIDGHGLDGSFALDGNKETIDNYTGDALKKTHDAAVFLMNARYGKTPERIYFVGGSTGGREALQVAQQWPTDFDGVVSMAPAWNGASLDLEFGRLTNVFSQPGAWPNPAKQTLIYNAVMDACDGNDGASDGLISNPGGCHYDPHVLRCPDGTDTGDTCLSDVQVNALIAADGSLKVNYPLASGETGYPGFPFLSGMEMRDPKEDIGSKPPANPTSSGSGFYMRFWEQWIRNFVTQDAKYNALTVDPQNPGQWQQRISELTERQDINNPDLNAFATAGGKMLIVHGTSDQIVSYRSTVDYFNRVQATMGSEAVNDFARLYLVPGFDHWTKAVAFNPLWDWAAALDNWVENDQAPQSQVASDTTAEGNNRTRPLCEYPAWPKYNGTGDVNQANNFTCVTAP
ncbi:tannase/feruloyl esterase family alpha/beta hydrolase [Rhodococcus sp. NPDC059968]|uniref:tannase/feruloyl esterase family alpha/beta hydrolase n=1 Tax=Rhodococcus sp. NPDC059968 TaxID=3347017 RepID=UPI003670DF99